MIEAKDTTTPLNSNERAYDALKLLGTKEVALILGCSFNIAQKIMHRNDFSLIKAGKNFRVSEKALAEWVMGRHV